MRTVYNALRIPKSVKEELVREVGEEIDCIDLDNPYLLTSVLTGIPLPICSKKTWSLYGSIGNQLIESKIIRFVTCKVKSFKKPHKQKRKKTAKFIVSVIQDFCREQENKVLIESYLEYLSSEKLQNRFSDRCAKDMFSRYPGNIYTKFDGL